MTCVQAVALDSACLTSFQFDRHFWIVDGETLDRVSHDRPVTMTRRYRCLRCGETHEVSGEPSLRYLTRA